MLTIWKFPLGNGGDQVIDMPEAAHILCVQDPEAPLETRRIYIRGTGHEMGVAAVRQYIGTIQQQGGLFVWHIFDGGKEPSR